MLVDKKGAPSTGATRDSLAVRIYHSKKLKELLNGLPRGLAYPLEAGAMLTVLGLDGVDRMLHGARRSR